MNLSKTNLLFGYLHIISALVIAILSYLSRKEIEVDTRLYTYEVSGVTDGMSEVSITPREEFNISTQTIQILLVTMFCVAGLFHLFYFTNGFYSNTYIRGLREGHNKYRWLEFSITSAIIVFILSLLAGFKDMYTVIFSCILIALFSVIGFFIESTKKKSEKTVGIFASAGILTVLLTLFYFSFFSYREEISSKGTKVPEWLTGVIVGTGSLLVCLTIVTILYVGGYGIADFDYIMYEKLYTYISFLTKAYMGYYTAYGILN